MEMQLTELTYVFSGYLEGTRHSSVLWYFYNK